MPTNFDIIIRFMELLRSAYVDMTLAQAQTFLAISQNKHITQLALAESLGQSTSAVSRNVYALSTGSKRVKGRSLIQSLNDQLEQISHVRKAEG